ncbi:MAG: ATP-binding protein [Chitinophagales bacterium]
MEGTHNILLLDGNEQSAQDIQRFLRVSAFTFSLSHASALDEGLNYLKARRPDLLLLDSTFIKQPGFDNLKQHLQIEHIPVVLLSDLNIEESRKSAEKAGASDYLVKNKINLFHLQKSIVSALKLNEAEAKIDNTHSIYAEQTNSFYQLLSRVKSGVVIINAKNTILYANNNAYNILSEPDIQKNVGEYMTFRQALDEQVINLNVPGRFTVTISISNLEWKGERANLVLLDKTFEESTVTDIQNDKNLHSVLNALTESVLVLDGNTILYANTHALSVLKVKQSEIFGNDLSSILSRKADSQHVSIQNLFSEQNYEGVMALGDGSEVKVLCSLKPLHISSRFYQILSLTERTIESLEEIPKHHAETERFSSEGVLHLASHDLREPVRTIINYTQLISDNLQKGKLDEASEYADFAHSAAERMERLLSDLKTYISLNEYNFQLGKVSMKMLVTDVVKNFKARIEAEEAEVSFAELPDVSADRELVEKLISTLIDNALKFRKKNRKPVIDIGFDKFEGNIIFCVRDNGMGISKKYYQRIFNLFERLNRVDEFPGNGLGLPICKKIVEMHGGEIWVESLPGSGSNFYFTLRGK